MPVDVGRSDRDECDARPDGVDEGRGGARDRPVVSHFQHVGGQAAARVRQEPGLFPTLRVAGQQEAHGTVADPHDGARLVRIRERGGPGGIRGEELDLDAVDVHALTDAHSLPAHPTRRRFPQHVAVDRASLRVRRVTQFARPEGAQDTGGAAEVVRVRMRQHEHREFAATTAQVRDHRGTPGVAGTPPSPHVHDDPPPARRAQGDRVPLPHVEQMQLHVRAAHRRTLGQPSEQRQGGHADEQGRPPVARPPGHEERKGRGTAQRDGEPRGRDGDRSPGHA